MANGTVVTRKGLQLIAKLVASETALTFTRVAIGTGKVPGGYDPGSMTGLNEYKMDGSIASHSASGDEASVVMQISSIGVETGFTITEAGLFATDPDEGEILYAYLDMSADPQYMYPENNAISKFIELTLVVKIGEVQSVTAVINPGSLITEEKFEAEKAETVHKSDIINSFSDTAGDHETVMGTVMGYQHDRDIKWLKGYAVTKEMISNQNVESADLVPSAYLLYQLNKTLLKKCEDLLAKYNALNSNIGLNPIKTYKVQDVNVETNTLQKWIINNFVPPVSILNIFNDKSAAMFDETGNFNIIAFGPHSDAIVILVVNHWTGHSWIIGGIDTANYGNWQWLKLFS